MTTRKRFEEVARDLDIPGRSTMSKDELEAAVLDQLDSTDLPYVLPDYGVDRVEPSRDDHSFRAEPDEPVSDEALAAGAQTDASAAPEVAEEPAFEDKFPEEAPAAADVVPEQDENAEAPDEA